MKFSIIAAVIGAAIAHHHGHSSDVEAKFKSLVEGGKKKIKA
jgi:hypothetical protein